MKVVLYADANYWKLTEEEKAQICNGCGSKGAWYNFLIPSRAFDECCHIHDYDYSIGKTEKEKRLADRRFMQNMKRVVRATKNRFLKKWRALKAKAFYKGVKNFGDEAYWSDKVTYENSKGEEVEI